MHSIRTRITAITAAAILTCVLALTAISFFTISKETDRMSAEKMTLQSKNVQQELDSYLASIKQSVEMTAHIAMDSLDAAILAESGAAGAAAGNQPRTAEQTALLDTHLAEHCRKVQESFSSVANHTSGVVTYYYCIAPEISVNQHGFFYSKVGLTGFAEQEPLDARTLDPEDTEHTTWYYTPIQRGRPSWVGPYRAHFLGELWTLSYLAPIYKAGTLVGVLGMDILLDTMIDRIEDIVVYETGFISLLTADGIVLYHPHLESGSKSVMYGTNQTNERQNQQDSGNEVIRYLAGGTLQQMGFSTLSNGIKVVASAPVSEITAGWQNLSGLTILTGFAILVLFITITMAILHHMTQPLQTLTDASKKLAAGDYDVDLNYHKKDEIGVLTESFRQLRDHLKMHISDLNSKAYTDALTGVKNKAAYDISSRRLNQQIRFSKDAEEHPEFGLIMFDCNNLKEINDKYSHERGDIYLQTASAAICRVFAHSPVFRLGGDEFAVLLQNQDYADREDLLAQFDALTGKINAAAENPWERADLARGMAEFRPGEDADTEAVLHRADERMYEHKRMSRSNG